MSSIRRGSQINLLTRLGGLFLGLALTVYTARLGTAQQGAFALFMALEAVALALVSGFGVAIARRSSHHRERPVGLVGASLLASLALGLLAALGLGAFSMQVGPSYEHLWLLAPALPLGFMAACLSGLWLGQGDMRTLAWLSLGVPFLTLAGVVLAHLLGRPPGLFTVLVAWVTARVLVGLAALLVARRGAWLGRPDGAALRAQARFVAVIGLTNLIGLLNYKVDIFLVDHFLGLSATGQYSVAVTVAELLWLVSSAISTAAYAAIGTPDAREASRLTLRAVHVTLLMLAALCPLLWLAVAALLPWALGAAYAQSLPSLALLLPGVAAFGAASVLSAWFTNHAGRPLVPATLALLSLCINVTVSWLSIPHLGMLGGALATSLSYGVTVALAAWWFIRASGTPATALLRPNWRVLAQDLRRLKPRRPAH